MSDINLLPVDVRKKDFTESKKKIEEKSHLGIELTDPNKLAKKPETLSGSFWPKLKLQTKNKIKKIYKIFERKKLIEKEKLTVQTNNHNNAKTLAVKTVSTPKHFKELSQVPVQKHFYYQNNIQELPIKDKSENKIKKVVKKETILPKKIEKVFKTEDKDKIKTIPIQSKSVLNTKQSNSKKQETFLGINLVPKKIRDLADIKIKIKILLAVIVSTIIVCFGVYSFLKRTVNVRKSQISALDFQIQSLTEQNKKLKEKNQDVNQFIGLLRETKKLINNHITHLKVLKFLQDKTLKNIYYVSYQVNAEEFSINLLAKAKDYETLAKQLLIFRSSPDIKEVNLTSAKVEEIKETENANQKKDKKNQPKEKEVISFDIKIIFKPEMFFKDK